MKHFAIIAALLLPVASHAGNYATCLLDKLPRTANDVAANAIVQLCFAEHPGGLHTVKQGAGRGFFGFKSGAACTAEKAGDARSTRAAQMIAAACRKLYDTPSAVFDPSTARPVD